MDPGDSYCLPPRIALWCRPSLPGFKPTQPVTIKAASFQPAHTQEPGTSKIPAQLTAKVGHEEDYSSVTGRLQKENGIFVIQYASPAAASPTTIVGGFMRELS